jgi:hypothetical protein
MSRSIGGGVSFREGGGGREGEERGGEREGAAGDEAARGTHSTNTHSAPAQEVAVVARENI